MAALLLAILLFQEAPAKDDPFETRVHNVEFLTRPVFDHPGVNITLSEDAQGATTDSAELSSGRLSGEAIIALISNNIAEDTWEHASASIHYENGALTVTNRKSVQDKVAEYLDYWRGLLGKKVVLDAIIVSVDPGFLAGLRAEGPADRPGVMLDDQVAKLLAAAREGESATLVKSMRTTAHPGQRVHMSDKTARSYIADYDVQVAVGVAALDPIPNVLRTGIMVDIRPRLEPFSNAVTMEIRIDRLELRAMTERGLKLPREVFPAWPVVQADPKNPPPAQPLPGAATRIDEPKVTLPKGSHDSLRTTLTVKSGESAVAGATFRAGRVVVYLLRPSVVTLEDKPAPEPAFDEQRLLKLYDISPLTRGVQDFASGSIGIQGPGGAGGALAGASFTLEEGRGMQHATANIIEMIRLRIAPDTWANRRNRIEEAAPGTLLVRQRPEVLREVETFLGDLISARAQMITTEAVLVGFRKESRAEWEKRIPALGPGGYFVPREQFDELIKETEKGGDVRLLEWSEITSFPQQRVHAARLEQEKYVADLEPQVGMASFQADPVVSLATTGFILDARPHFIRGTERIGIEVKIDRREHQMTEAVMVPPAMGPIQLPGETAFGRASTVACKEGHLTLVAIESRGTGDNAEDVALFMRARANALK